MNNLFHSVHRMHPTHINQTKLDEKKPSPPSSFLSSPLKATPPLPLSLCRVQRHIFLLRYLNPANYAYFAFACNDETIFHHYSRGKAAAPPSSPLSSRVSAFALASSSQFTRVQGNS